MYEIKNPKLGLITAFIFILDQPRGNERGYFEITDVSREHTWSIYPTYVGLV